MLNEEALANKSFVIGRAGKAKGSLLKGGGVTLGD